MRSYQPLFPILISLFLFLSGSAQDIHFSQFQAAPSNLNPSLTGAFTGDYRFSAIHRNQWNSVSKPYSTFGVSADAKAPKDIERLGAGASIYHDITGDSRYRTLQIALSASYRIFLTSDSTHRLAAGLRPRFEHKSIDVSQLSFDNQYNGTRYDPSRSTGESLARQQRNYLDADLGLRYALHPDKERNYGAGIALYNLFKPQQSFYDAGKVRRDRRMTLFAEGTHPVSADINILPAAYLGIQGKYHELIFGTEGEYILKDKLGMYRSIFLGLWYRTRDAGFVTAGLRYDEWRLGLSYDVNVSELEPASKNRGGFEISLRYILQEYERPDEAHKTCPTFI